MTKEEKIQEAYGDKWESINLAGKKCALKNDGWIGSIIDHAPKGIDLDFADYTFRPKSLRGIKCNNGWVKIYRENDMPQFECKCFILDKKQGLILGTWRNPINETDDKIQRKYWLENATHYKIIEKPSMPLY